MQTDRRQRTSALQMHDRQSMDARFLLPRACAACGLEGTVRAETTVRGAIVRLTWACGHCRREWPISEADRDRRRSTTERRQSARGDRRDAARVS
jgi:hypothetical protein